MISLMLAYISYHILFDNISVIKIKIRADTGHPRLFSRLILILSDGYPLFFIIAFGLVYKTSIHLINCVPKLILG